MSTFQRYMLYQIPGYLLDIAVLAALRHWWGLPLWAACGIFALLVIKDFVLYPWLKVGYETRAKSGMEKLVGECAVVKQRLDPDGYVLVRGELWKARAARGQFMDAGARVRISGHEGMLLWVEPAPADTDAGPND